MKKIISVVLSFTISTTFLSQIGVHTSNPLASFHIDSAKDNIETGTPTLAQQSNDVVVSSSGNMGLGIITPTEKLDVASGKVRLRKISSTIGVGGTDRKVVADSDGILKTVAFANYTLFYAELATDQNDNIGGTGVETMLFSEPKTDSPLYSYDPVTGYLTFNEPGNYLINLQASFTNTSSSQQLLLGIRPVPDNNYIGRGSHYTISSTNGTTGEIMNYTTTLIITQVGYKVRFTFTCGAGSNCKILAAEPGNTIGGKTNVTNIYIRKI